MWWGGEVTEEEKGWRTEGYGGELERKVEGAGGTK